MFKWIVGVLALAAALHACRGAPSSGPLSDSERDQIDQRVQAYFKKAANLPPDIVIKVMDLEPSDISGLLAGNLEVSNGSNTQKVPLVVTRDGHYVIQGQVSDLTVDPYKATMERIALKDEPMRGNPSARVTIVEYSDFQCPFCARAYGTLEDQVLKAYGDKVRLVFKNFPLTNIHPWAESAALASQCVRQQSPDAFWKAYDFLFKNQSDLTPDNVKEKVGGVVRDAGLDTGKFETCFDGKAALDTVKAHEQEATALGVRSTPTFFVNGRKLEGALPYENFKSAIDEALSGT